VHPSTKGSVADGIDGQIRGIARAPFRIGRDLIERLPKLEIIANSGRYEVSTSGVADGRDRDNTPDS